jgi:hypothetical protein
MRFILDWLRLVVLWAVSSIAAISGFAQSDNDRSSSQTASTGVAREYVPGATAAPSRSAVPSNLSIPTVYAEIVESMLARSPTFRRQCDRLEGAPNVRVVVERYPADTTRGARARTTIGRAGDRILALVRIITDGRVAELISHELAHVIEYLDDVDLASLARMGSSGVHRCDCDGAYETVRAVHVGKKVLREVQSGQ